MLSITTTNTFRPTPMSEHGILNSIVLLSLKISQIDIYEYWPPFESPALPGRKFIVMISLKVKLVLNLKHLENPSIRATNFVCVY